MAKTAAPARGARTRPRTEPVRDANPFDGSKIEDRPSPAPAVSSVQHIADTAAGRRAQRAASIAQAPTPKRRLKVRATQTGYYGHARRRIGDVFVIDGAKDRDGKVIAFSERWMELVNPETAESLSTGNEEIARKNADVRALKFGGQPQHEHASSAGDESPLGDD